MTIDSVYLAPDTDLNPEDYADLVHILEALFPMIQREWYADFTNTYQSVGLISVVDYTRCTILSNSLKRYRDMLMDTIEDIPSLTDTALQMSETCKAMSSIQEQFARVCSNIHEIEGVVAELSKEEEDLFGTHIDKLLDEAKIDHQLELDLGI